MSFHINPLKFDRLRNFSSTKYLTFSLDSYLKSTQYFKNNFRNVCTIIKVFLVKRNQTNMYFVMNRSFSLGFDWSFGKLDGYKTRNVFMAQTSSLLEEFFGSSVIEAVKLFLGTDEPSNNVTKIILKSQFDLMRQINFYKLKK